MTAAVCYRCGAMKFGAFVPCPECAEHPRTEDDLVLSLAMTDHYFDLPTLEQIGASVRDGKPPVLDPNTQAMLMRQVRSSGLMEKLQRVSDRGAAGGEGLRPGGLPRRRRPWWQFW